MLVRICHANTVRLSVRPSVGPLHACFVSKRLNVSLKFFHYLIGPSFCCFVTIHQGSIHKSDGFTPNRGTKCKGVAIFDQYAVMSQKTVINTGICNVSNSATFDDIEWPRTPVSRSQYTLKAIILPTVHPIHFMFGSRLLFFGSVDWMPQRMVR